MSCNGGNLVKNNLILECDLCGHFEKYNHENDFFQDGIMHGLRGKNEDEIHCINCIVENH